MVHDLPTLTGSYTVFSVKENRILDQKKSQNLSIFLGSIKMEYQEVRRLILQCSADLEGAVVSGLINQLPEADQIGNFKELKPEYEELVEAEKFW